MASGITRRRQRPEICWTPRLIRRLRGKRTQAEFGTLLGTSKNTVWRWEAGQARPDAGYVGRLTELAERERFLTDWQIVGSMVLVGDLESARADIATLFRTSLERTSCQLVE
jgi:transcriptional regulator with XRE-family HTH domain